MEDSDIFIKKIKINKVRHLKDIEILISDNKKKHLILTGINGSGKTSLLEALSEILNWTFIQNGSGNTDGFFKNRDTKKRNIERLETQLNNSGSEVEKNKIKKGINELSKSIQLFNGYIEKYTAVELEVNNHHLVKDLVVNSNFIIDFEQYERKNNQHPVEGPKIIKFKKSYEPTHSVSDYFAQYLTNQRMDMLDEKEENELEKYKQKKEWFANLENIFKEIYNDDQLKLKYNKNRKIYEIIQKNREPFALNEMASGYAAYFKLITELLLRMEINKPGSYEVPGICLIDEIETHLHIDLQRKSLPLLTRFFPNIQFIVTTHSPFIINSTVDSVVYDLENQILIDDDPTKFSGDTITKLYLRSDSLSDEIKRKLETLNTLAEKSEHSDEEKEKWKKLISYFNSILPFIDDDVKTSLTAIKIKSFLKDD